MTHDQPPQPCRCHARRDERVELRHVAIRADSSIVKNVRRGTFVNRPN